MKIIIDDKIPYIRGAFEDVAEVIYLPGSKTTAEIAKNADAIVTRTRTICNEKLLAGSSVKFIATATIGYDHIDTDYCDAAGIKWTNAPGCNSKSVEQYIASTLMVLAETKKLQLKDLCIGIVGVGNVGSKVAKICEIFGMKVLLNDPPRERAEGSDKFVSLETIKNEADIISLHVPLNIKGEDTGRKVTLNDAIFGIEPNDHAIYLDVKQHLANKRQGTHKSKERSELSGSTRKLIKQKGGGGARRGDINSPLLVGGARVFGPKPRDYEFKLNKKVKGLARKSAMAYKAQANAIVVVEDFAMEAPKTKEFTAITKNLKVADRKLLLVLAERNNFVYLSARNIEKANVITASEINTYAVLNATSLVLTESSVAVIDNLFKA